MMFLASLDGQPNAAVHEPQASLASSLLFLVLTDSVQNNVFCFVEGGMVYLAGFPFGCAAVREYCVCLESCIEEPALR